MPARALAVLCSLVGPQFPSERNLSMRTHSRRLLFVSSLILSLAYAALAQDGKVKVDSSTFGAITVPV